LSPGELDRLRRLGGALQSSQLGKLLLRPNAVLGQLASLRKNAALE
jgi:hypothetical protein